LPDSRTSVSTAFIALGANLGDPVATLKSALHALDALPHTRLVRSSRFVRSPSMGAPGPDYVNAVAELATTLEPTALLRALLAIEQAHGRTRAERNAPRTLDLDLLLYDERVLDTPQLVPPHPRLHERAFVLVPLAELDPQRIVPGHGRVVDLLPAVASQHLDKLPAS
jgi:2-amino-4-hydroxy-6-hydroxymethyldihydropteridine diphosphokinase